MTRPRVSGCFSRGELGDAYESFNAALGLMRAAGQELDAIRGAFVPADIRVAQGRLREAQQLYERALESAKVSLDKGAADIDELHIGLSEIFHERGDLDTAARHLHVIEELTANPAHTGNRARWNTAMSRLAESRGKSVEALALLDEAERTEIAGPLPRLRPVPALRARIWITQGRLAEAQEWATRERVLVDDELTYLHEFEHITLARLLLARYRADGDEHLMRETLALLERLLIAAAQGGRKRSTIEILVLEALVHHSASNARAALDSLERALVLAAPETYLRLFVDEGESMRDLLRHAAGRGIGGAFTAQLLSALERPTDSVAVTVPVVSSAPADQASAPLLTARELEILRLIAVGMRNQEIAGQLDISTATVKRHVANTYVKLDVSHRTEALARARSLSLL